MGQRRRLAAFGVLGAFGGSTLGKAIDGQRLLFLFAIIMVIVGILMLRSRRKAGVGIAPLPQRAPAFTWKLAFVALAVGLLSGFFGIGGGFLIVPGLMFATGMPLINAIGSSLFAGRRLRSGNGYELCSLGIGRLENRWRIHCSGFVGGWLGMNLAFRIGSHKSALNTLFASIIFAVAAYMFYRTAGSWIRPP